MVDENATQQGSTPRIVLENVSAAIVVAEELLNSTNNVHEFNAELHRSQELLQKSQYLVPDNVISWRTNEYEKAQLAIAPGGDGLGRAFIAHFFLHR